MTDRRLRVVLSGMGSLGDARPFLLLALELLARGHDALLCVSKDFEENAREAGIPFRLYDFDVRETLGVLDPGRSGAFLRALKLRERWIAEQFGVLTEACKSCDLLISGAMELPAPSVAEFYGIPWLKNIFYPSVRSQSYPPAYCTRWNLPRALNPLLWRGFFWLLALLAAGPVNRERRKLRLPPVYDFERYFSAQDHTIYAVDEALVPPCPSWLEGSYSYTGYGFAGAARELPRGLRDFLSSGPPPVYIGFGSMTHRDPEALSRTIVTAVGDVGCRAVLARGWAGIGSGELPASVCAVGDVPHDLLFPVTAGVIHHGGSGTTHSAARAGVPQLVVPFDSDQIHYGSRVHALRLGPKPLPIGELCVEALGGRLRELLHTQSYAREAAGFGERLRGVNGSFEAVDLIEACASRWRTRRPARRIR